MEQVLAILPFEQKRPLTTRTALGRKIRKLKKIFKSVFIYAFRPDKTGNDVLFDEL
jgi:hypothetical protein